MYTYEENIQKAHLANECAGQSVTFMLEGIDQAPSDIAALVLMLASVSTLLSGVIHSNLAILQRLNQPE